MAKLFSKFPKDIYVVKCNPGDSEEYWMQYDNIEDAIEEADSQGSKVARYALAEIGTPVIERSLA